MEPCDFAVRLKHPFLKPPTLSPSNLSFLLHIHLRTHSRDCQCCQRLSSLLEVTWSLVAGLLIPPQTSVVTTGMLHIEQYLFSYTVTSSAF